MKPALLLKSLTPLLVILGMLTVSLAFSQTPSGNLSSPPAAKSGAGREASSTYVISPLDKLLIVVYGGDRQTGEYEKIVQSDGTVYLPFLEQDVKIGGIMLLEAEKKLEDLSRKVIREPRVVITVMSSFYQNVFTYGKISNSNVELNTPLRVLQLIARVGGPQEGAVEDSIRVISTDGSVRYFNYRKVNRNPASEENFFLKPGDVVFVPGANDFTVQVMGEVRTAGQYSLKNGDRVLDALLRAGSWSSTAEIKKVRLLRNSRGKNVTREVNLDTIFKNANSKENILLQNGDILFVPARNLNRLQSFYMMITTVSVIVTTMVLVKNN